MSEAQTVSYELRATGSTIATRQWFGVLLAAVLLSAICVGEVLFLRYVGGPEMINVLTVAEGVVVHTG